jgi:hypothetical protein
VPEDGEHLALELRVGLPDSRSLVAGGGDLDNYLFPIVRGLGADRFDAVFGCRVHAPMSTIAVAPACAREWATGPDMVVRTSVSASSPAWKRQVREACAAVSPQVDDGALALDLEFRVSGARNWSTLWKPAIDSLGPVLGVANPSRPFAPNDDRIVSLGLHRVIDDTMGWDVALSVWWSPTP